MYIGPYARLLRLKDRKVGELASTYAALKICPAERTPSNADRPLLQTPWYSVAPEGTAGAHGVPLSAVKAGAVVDVPAATPFKNER